VLNYNIIHLFTSFKL